MPFGDCTGPWWLNEQFDRSYGRGFGFGRGFGRRNFGGRGFGRGFGRSFGFFNWFNSGNNDARRAWLENRKRVLEAELDAINKELQQ